MPRRPKPPENFHADDFVSVPAGAGTTNLTVLNLPKVAPSALGKVMDMALAGDKLESRGIPKGPSGVATSLILFVVFTVAFFVSTLLDRSLRDLSGAERVATEIVMWAASGVGAISLVVLLIYLFWGGYKDVCLYYKSSGAAEAAVSYATTIKDRSGDTSRYVSEVRTLWGSVQEMQRYLSSDTVHRLRGLAYNAQAELALYARATQENLGGVSEYRSQVDEATQLLTAAIEEVRPQAARARAAALHRQQLVDERAAQARASRANPEMDRLRATGLVEVPGTPEGALSSEVGQPDKVPYDGNENAREWRLYDDEQKR